MTTRTSILMLMLTWQHYQCFETLFLSKIFGWQHYQCFDTLFLSKIFGTSHWINNDGQSKPNLVGNLSFYFFCLLCSILEVHWNNFGSHVIDASEPFLRLSIYPKSYRKCFPLILTIVNHGSQNHFLANIWRCFPLILTIVHSCQPANYDEVIYCSRLGLATR